MKELVEKFSDGLDFDRSEKFGWLTSNLQTLGSGICCKIRLKCIEPMDCIDEICAKSRIKITRIDETNAVNDHLIELSSLRTFGVSEFECVKSFYDGVKEIIETLENNEMVTETVNENVDELNTQLGNSDKMNTNPDETTPIESSSQQNKENNEVNAAEESVENEQPTAEINENQDEKSTNDENVANPPEHNGDAIENNADNLAEGEKLTDGDTVDENNQNDVNEANPSETNQNEANSNETETSDKPNDSADQSTNQADDQTTEG